MKHEIKAKYLTKIRQSRWSRWRNTQDRWKEEIAWVGPGVGTQVGMG